VTLRLQNALGLYTYAEVKALGQNYKTEPTQLLPHNGKERI